MIVVDASLAAKWISWEEDSADALRFLFKYRRELCAPDLVFIEVARVIVRNANERKDIEADAIAALTKWTTRWGDHALKPHRVTQKRLFNAGCIAIEIGHPLSDCIYLELAMQLGCELATCDAKFAAKARKLYPYIRLLRDYDVSDVTAVARE